MILQLSDLDELLQQVRNSHSRNYLNEAIISYRAGAYRASIISTWISVCVDIIEKIRELSISDDKTAIPKEERLKGIQPHDVAGMLAFEKDILDIACDDLQLISVIEKSHLERLKDDRNVCAHPTFSQDGTQFSPSPELTRAYIVQAANYLLIHAPVKGKVVINHLFELVNAESFPEDEERAFSILSSDSYLGRVRASSVRNLIIIFLKRLFKDDEGISTSLLDKISAALGAIGRMYPEIYREVLSEKINQLLAEANDKQLKRIFPFLVNRHDSWGNIEKAVKIRMDGLLSTMNAESLINYRVLKLSSINPDVDSILQLRVEQLDYRERVKLLESGSAITLKEEAIKIFIDSGSFAVAYRNGMDILLPYVEFFDEDDIQNIFEGAFKNTQWGINQILNAAGIDEVFCRMYSETKDNIGQHGRIWKNFYEKLIELGFSNKELKQLLIEDGELEPEQGDDPVGDDREQLETSFL